MSEEKELQVDFSDLTLIQSEGKFDKVNELMRADLPQEEIWMIRSTTTLATEAGMSEMILHFYSDKNVYIMEYVPSSPDVYFNTDIQYLSWWLQDHGWKVPRPYVDLVKTNVPLWKQYWETMLIDSPDLDYMFGKRLTDYSEDIEE